MSRIRNYIIIITLLILAGGIGYRLGENHLSVGVSGDRSLILKSDTPKNVSVDFSLFWDVWDRVHRYYIDSSHIDNQKLFWGAISGMVNALDDPYTTFLPPQENTAFKQDLGGQFDGIGAELGEKENRIIVVAPLKKSPAEAAGIKPGDWILKVDNNDTLNWTTQQAVSRIRGQKGTKVVLQILHENTIKPLDISITRDTINVPSVDAWVKKPSEITEIQSVISGFSIVQSPKYIAYISLSRFGDKLTEEWTAGIDSIIAAQTSGKNVAGLVFDLRNDPGGYLDGSVYIASEFLTKGVVVSQVNYDGTREDHEVDRKGRMTDIPLVVLVNKGSASAAEIVSGALKDYKRATIVGETTFGKGSVQSPQDLSGGSSLHVTTGKWLTPKGNSISKIGITPDVEVKSDAVTATADAQLAKAVQILLK
jgi:carboxyl-terminal processing protease